jgi:glutathione S-transferase
VILYGSLLSPFVRKVAVILELKGLDYKNMPTIPPSPDPDYLQISPLGKIPALEDDELAISDSSVICEYLEEQYPDRPTMPKDSIQRARARWLEEYSDSKLAELCVDGIFFEKFVKPILLKTETNHFKVDKTISELLPPAQDYLESQLPAEGFLFGDIGRADICIVSFFITAGYVDYQVNSKKWTKLAAFIKRVKEQPTVAKLLNIEAKVLGEMLGS